MITNIHIYNNIMTHLLSAGISIVTEGRGTVDVVYVNNNVVAHVSYDGYLVAMTWTSDLDGANGTVGFG